MKLSGFILAVVCLVLTVNAPLSTADGDSDLELQITDAQVTCTGEAHLCGAYEGRGRDGDFDQQGCRQSDPLFFVYDAEVRMVAHPRSELVGKSFKGQPDVKGNPFRDEIVARAL